MTLVRLNKVTGDVGTNILSTATVACHEFEIEVMEVREAAVVEIVVVGDVRVNGECEGPDHVGAVTESIMGTAIVVQVYEVIVL